MAENISEQQKFLIKTLKENGLSCSYGAIHNINWERGIEREKLFDAYVCNEKRLDYIPVIGRKHSCGLCLQACKIGEE